jgi:hypothetical protein
MEREGGGEIPSPGIRRGPPPRAGIGPASVQKGVGNEGYSDFVYFAFSLSIASLPAS